MSCTLTWQPPENDGGSPITGYIIERTTGYSSRWTKVNKDPIKSLMYNFEDLIEMSEYEFRVCAVNEAGVGKPSPGTGTFIAKDPYDAPGKPGTPVVDEITMETANLTWTPPPSDGGSPITNYIVEARILSEIKWKKVSEGETVPDKKFTVKGLQEDTQYEFRVTAENKAGQGPPSDPSKPAMYGKLSRDNLSNCMIQVPYLSYYKL